MDTDQAIELGRNAVITTLTIGTPIMLVAVVVGLVVSIMQAVTQLQDQTLSFVPKIVAMTVALLYLLPWIIGRMVDYTTNLYQDIPSTL